MVFGPLIGGAFGAAAGVGVRCSRWRRAPSSLDCAGARRRPRFGSFALLSFRGACQRLSPSPARPLQAASSRGVRAPLSVVRGRSNTRTTERERQTLRGARRRRSTSRGAQRHSTPPAAHPSSLSPSQTPKNQQQLGYSIFSQDRPRSYKFITAAADADENIRTPAVATVDSAMRALLPLTPEWTSQPDYERWVMVTRVLRLMWPKLTAAILKEVIKVAKPILQTELGKIPALRGVLQDVTLGGHSLLDAEHHDAVWEQASKDLHLGDHPVRVAGMKVYSTTEDTCILETVLMWGGNMALDLSVYLKLGPLTVVVPVCVSDVQFKARARITLSPLVDTLPCIGGVTLSLLDVPHVDFKLRLFNGPDLMAFPGVQDATRAAISFVVTQVALYPNSVSVPLMENYGIPQAPKGMVHVRLHKADVRERDRWIMGRIFFRACGRPRPPSLPPQKTKAPVHDPHHSPPPLKTHHHNTNRASAAPTLPQNPTPTSISRCAREGGNAPASAAAPNNRNGTKSSSLWSTTWSSSRWPFA